MVLEYFIILLILFGALLIGLNLGSRLRNIKKNDPKKKGS